MIVFFREGSERMVGRARAHVHDMLLRDETDVSLDLSMKLPVSR
jgi:hypothetical protein